MPLPPPVDPQNSTMSLSPIPGTGTLLRVEEVRQRLNQCGLQGEKVTRKTARKYVPPTATASRTVADMARRLGSVGPEGREPHTKSHSNGEEKFVTGEIYRSFSIHTRNIHKKFNMHSETSTASGGDGSVVTTTKTSEISVSSTSSEMTNNGSHNPSVSTKETCTKMHNVNSMHALSPISLKIASAPITNKHNGNHIADPIPFIAVSKAPDTTSSDPSTLPHPHTSAQTDKPHTAVKDTTKSASNHITESDSFLRTPIQNSLEANKNDTTPKKQTEVNKNDTTSKKQTEANKSDTAPKKQTDANKSFLLKNINPFSKFKISAFSSKKTPTENKSFVVKNSPSVAPKEAEKNHNLNSNNSPQITTPCNTPSSPKISKDVTLPTPLSNGNVCDIKTISKSPPSPGNKITPHTKHALSAGRRNIQELMNSPKVPKKDSTGIKNKPYVLKDENLKTGNLIQDKTINTSLKTPDTTNSNTSNAISHHNNIPHLNNIKNTTKPNSNTLITNGINDTNSNNSKDVDKPNASNCDISVDKPTTNEEKADAATASPIECDTSSSSQSKEEASKPNGVVEPMDYTGVVFYKAKCLLNDKMGSKEKVKVDESEPSFYEEAPFERRDVTVKCDRWVTDLYTVDSLLGKGKFGEVKKCQERKTGRQLAAKFIEVNGPQDRNDVLNELEIMKNLQHPRLLQLYDAFEIRDKFCLVMELVNGGELFERVINDDFILTEKACVMFTRQICDGVAFMHSQNILHLDMKPENILCLTREGNRIKIIDFGLARKYNPKDDLRVLFGTPEFVAPEVVNFDPIAPATDMWSIGVVCYVLLSGLSPFMGESEQETLANVTLAQWDFSAEEFDSISSEAKDFISKLLVKDPRKRMKSSECLEHQWLRRSVKREGNVPERSLSKKRLRKFVYRRKWQKAINAMLALRRMGVTLS